MENHEYDQIIGSVEAPFINSLADSYTLATDYHGVTHPSLPNYLSMVGGSTFGITSDCTDCFVGSKNLADQLEAAGISWKAYMESMPSPCFKGPFAGTYAMKHDPFMYFRDIRDDPTRCANVVPFTQMAVDIGAGTLPQFSFVSPNLCNDMHDCPVATGDAWLRAFMASVLPALGPDGVVVVTFDEGTTSAGCCSKASGGHVVTILAGPGASTGSQITKALDHYSLLEGIEQAWGLPLLGEAGCACTSPLPL